MLAFPEGTPEPHVERRNFSKKLWRCGDSARNGLLLNYLEQHDLPYIVVAKLTTWVKRVAQPTRRYEKSHC